MKISQSSSPYAPDPVRQAKVIAGPHGATCGVCGGKGRIYYGPYTTGNKFCSTCKGSGRR